MNGTITLTLDEIDSILLALSLEFEDAGKHIDWFVDPDCFETVEDFKSVMEVGRLMERFLKLRNTVNTGKECCRCLRK